MHLAIVHFALRLQGSITQLSDKKHSIVIMDEAGMLHLDIRLYIRTRVVQETSVSADKHSTTSLPETIISPYDIRHFVSSQEAPSVIVSVSGIRHSTQVQHPIM